MRIPNADRAVIDARKLHGYLLSQSHPIGRFKAAFFRSLGYSAEGWPLLEADLRAHLSHDAVPDEPSQYGQKYTIRATLVGPSGQTAGVARFVTAYPEVAG